MSDIATLEPQDDEDRELAEAAEAEAAAKKKARKQKIIVGSVIGGMLLLSAAGAVIWMSAPSQDARPLNEPYSKIDLANTGTAVENGTIAINPQEIALSPAEGGTYKAVVTVSALFQDFTVGSVEVLGDPGLALSSRCPAASQILKMGQQCQIEILWRPSPTSRGGATPANGPSGLPGQPLPQAAPAALDLTQPMPSIALRIAGTSVSSNGASIPIEQYVPISGFPGAASANFGGQGQMIDPYTGAVIAANSQAAPGGSYAGQGIDPYGPAEPNVQGTPLQPGTAGSGAGATATAQGPAPLSLREQYILARRQSVFSGVQPRYQQPQGGGRRGDAPAPGSWEEIKVPSVTSSAQQDMTRVLTMDRVITAVLMRNFDNRASQQVVAQVDRNVYGANGRAILIPRGSTIIGTMSAGAERSVVNWTQIIRPDGARFMMRATGGDATGQSGVPGYTNQRLGRRFGAVLLGTVLKSGVAAATNATRTEGVGGGLNGAVTSQANTGAIVTDIVTQDVNRIIEQIIAQNQNIMPVTVVPAGTRMTIFPQQDLVMYPVQRETITRPAYPRAMNGNAAVAQMRQEQSSDDYENGQ